MSSTYALQPAPLSIHKHPLLFDKCDLPLGAESELSYPPNNGRCVCAPGKAEQLG